MGTKQAMGFEAQGSNADIGVKGEIQDVDVRWLVLYNYVVGGLTWVNFPVLLIFA